MINRFTRLVDYIETQGDTVDVIAFFVVLIISVVLACLFLLFLLLNWPWLLVLLVFTFFVACLWHLLKVLK